MPASAFWIEVLRVRLWIGHSHTRDIEKVLFYDIATVEARSNVTSAAKGFNAFLRSCTYRMSVR